MNMIKIEEKFTSLTEKDLATVEGVECHGEVILTSMSTK